MGAHYPVPFSSFPDPGRSIYGERESERREKLQELSHAISHMSPQTCNTVPPSRSEQLQSVLRGPVMKALRGDGGSVFPATPAPMAHERGTVWSTNLTPASLKSLTATPLFHTVARSTRSTSTLGSHGYVLPPPFAAVCALCALQLRLLCSSSVLPPSLCNLLPCYIPLRHPSPFILF